MWRKIHTQFYPGVKAKTVWALWKDVNHWAKWHDDLDYCKLQGSFEVGNHFMLKPKGVKPVKIIITALEEGKEFTDCTSFPGAKMHDTHIVEEKDNGVLLTNILEVTGPLQWLWVKLVAGDVAKTVPHDMDTMIQLAKTQSYKEVIHG